VNVIKILENVYVLSGKFYCIIGWLTSVNFCNIAIQLIAYLRLDGRIATAVLLCKTLDACGLD